MRKILVSILLIVLLVLAFTISVSAVTLDDINSSMNAYAKEKLSGYVKETESNVAYATISEAFPMYNYDTNTVDSIAYFAIGQNNDILGMLNVVIDNGEYLSMYYCDVPVELQTMYNESAEISYGIYNGTFSVIDEDVCGVNAVKNRIINSNDALNLASPRSTTILFSRILDVPFVDGNFKLSNGKGACWAACVAMNVNYVRGYSLSATNIYDNLVNQYGETPAGNTLWISRAYSQYNITPTIYDNDTHNPWTLNYTEIYGNLYEGKPIHIGVRRSTGDMHGILITGITAYYETVISEYYAYYYFRDPVMNQDVCLQVDYDVMLDGTNLEYISPASSEYVYDEWIRTVQLTKIGG